MTAIAAFCSFFLVAFVTASLHLPPLLCIGAGLASVLVVAARRPRRPGRWR